MHVLVSKRVSFPLIIPLKDLHLFCTLVFLEAQAKSSRWHLPAPGNQQINENYMITTKKDETRDVDN